jgi:hypothetical protein
MHENPRNLVTGPCQRRHRWHLLAHALLPAAVLVALFVTGCSSVERGDDACRDPNGNDLVVGETFQNGCNTCTCNEDGSVACTEMGCASVCEQNGTQYGAGESFPAGDGCNLCQCMSSGEISCTAAACGSTCVYDSTVYQAGDSFPATDGCNTCSCSMDGSVLCTEIACGTGGGGGTGGSGGSGGAGGSGGGGGN